VKKLSLLFVLFIFLAIPSMAQDHKYVVPSSFKLAWELTPETLQTEIFLVKEGESRTDLEALLYMATEPGVMLADITLPESGVWIIGMRSFEIVHDYKNTSRTIWTDIDADHMLNGETFVMILVEPIDPPSNVGVVQ